MNTAAPQSQCDSFFNKFIDRAGFAEILTFNVDQF